MDKIKSTIYIENKLHKEVEKAVLTGEYSSKNDFYIKAIENQILNDTVNNGEDLIVDKLAKAIEKNTKTLGSRISKSMFRYAVELSMIMHMQAANMQLTSQEVSTLRGMAIKSIKSTNGIISLEEIANFQNKGNSVEKVYEAWED